MHNLKVRIYGSSSFISTLDELKIFLKFKCILDNLDDKFDIILFQKNTLLDKKLKNLIDNSDAIKILAGKKENFEDKFDACLELPASINEINDIVDNTAAKKKYSTNSSIKIKNNYSLNKNEKKLSKFNDYIVLTEKEVQLLELFLQNKNPISKDNILLNVWNYSSDADTHTVETHIYRLRKKIIDKFKDDKFILNNKAGYYL